MRGFWVFEPSIPPLGVAMKDLLFRVTRAAPCVMRRNSVCVSCQCRSVVNVEEGWIVTIVRPEVGRGVVEEEEEVGAGGKAKVVLSGGPRIKEGWCVVFVRGIVGCVGGEGAFLLLGEGKREDSRELNGGQGRLSIRGVDSSIVCSWRCRLSSHAPFCITSYANGSICKVYSPLFLYSFRGSIADYDRGWLSKVRRIRC